VLEGSGERMAISRLLALSRERQHNVVRAWLARLGLACPSHKTLHHIWSQVIDTSPESTPRLQWPGAEIRHYRDHLYAMPAIADFDHGQHFDWNMDDTITIAGVGRIRVIPGTGKGLVRQADRDVTIRFRKGGERCKLPNRGGEHSLKNLFQELGVVPWMRERIPLIYIGEKLAAIGDMLVCEGFTAGEQEEGRQIVCKYEHTVR
jgi:tRNA(Ile)-lysidine synthase